MDSGSWLEVGPRVGAINRRNRAVFHLTRINGDVLMLSQTPAAQKAVPRPEVSCWSKWDWHQRPTGEPCEKRTNQWGRSGSKEVIPVIPAWKLSD